MWTHINILATAVPWALAVALLIAPFGSAQARASRTVKSQHITLRHITTGKSVTNLRLIKPDPHHPKAQMLDPLALRKINDLFRDWRSKFALKINERLIWHLYMVAQHFDAPIEIVSGFRKEERTSSRHKQGRAVDFRVKGVDPKTVWTFCKRFHPVGVGYYPTSRFVHLDVRKRTHYWIDDSGPGEEPRYRSGVKQLRKKTRQRHLSEDH